MKKLFYFIFILLIGFFHAQVKNDTIQKHIKPYINPVKLTKKERSKPYMDEVLKSRDSLTPKEAERRRQNIELANPFKKYGFYPKIATLSKGKYLEVHDIDSIISIGSVRFNRKTRDIVEFREIDLSNPDAQPYLDTAGRWFSPDPLSEQFSSWTPYNYAFNNPINVIDPDGREGLGWGLKDNVWSWDANLTAQNYQQQGFSEYKDDGSVISNSTIQGQGGEAGNVYLGFNGQAQSIPAGGATSMLQLSNFTRDAISSTLSGIGSAINGLYDVWNIATFSPDPNMNINTPSATTPVGKALEMAGSVSPLLGVESSSANKITEPVTNTIYKRPSNATTPVMRDYANKIGQETGCATCGAKVDKYVADHIKPLVQEHYQTGTINQTQMRSLNSIQPQCQTCSAQQGGAMSKYSREMKKIIQQRTNGQ